MFIFAQEGLILSFIHLIITLLHHPSSNLITPQKSANHLSLPPWPIPPPFSPPSKVKQLEWVDGVESKKSERQDLKKIKKNPIQHSQSSASLQERQGWREGWWKVSSREAGGGEDRRGNNRGSVSHLYRTWLLGLLLCPEACCTLRESVHVYWCHLT